LDAAGFVCLDIGASTGGFTDCLLQSGAVKVYAIDVGYGQMNPKVANDERVVVMDRTNIRHVEPDAIPEKADLAVIDVSFISLKLGLGPVAALLKPGGRIVALVKPQFEVGKGKVGKGGIVRDGKQRTAALEDAKGYAVSEGFSVEGEAVSSVKGAKGNVEYLIYLVKAA
jgi:23S rRNA (cytidine1920-2'-O)/16S rRNA (cytidine1409-2'-O)-methyltransferase